MATTQQAEPNKEQLLALYERMLLIRRMEERLRAEAAAGSLPGAVHLYIGQEAVATGVCARLQPTDWITSTHRGHGHFLAKGGEPKAMMAEIWGKRTGICKGMGGSMHVADFSKGILGANGIVGAGFAIANGAALSAKLHKDPRISVAFFGDGASNQGVFMETLNVSSLWQLPLVLVCEHNRFSEFTPSNEVTSGEIADRARAFKMPTTVVDGNDVVAVWKAAGEAVERARSGGGPSFIEAQTYRIQGHLEAESLFLAGGKYRDQKEIDEWRKRDPIDRTAARLSAAGVGAKDLEAINARVLRTVEDAVKFAMESEPADTELAFDLMFSGQKA
ncbi:MAG TPA: thiamine pyrophosphate-dependent dehydrogenase E1 component subunit alpha [Steroidobacteraceae bacterium]|nr:thiamine pyrophosphate-dependent dehydrogenase E1 component subunit alpha [Steroidobacteraceae bacterium]HUK02208.1 thiamine pyrophosphate-dependent dehydrogenase E1 component subunit alpha [Steroidobacteraceae bacterium]